MPPPLLFSGRGRRRRRKITGVPELADSFIGDDSEAKRATIHPPGGGDAIGSLGVGRRRWGWAGEEGLTSDKKSAAARRRVRDEETTRGQHLRFSTVASFAAPKDRWRRASPLERLEVANSATLKLTPRIN